MNKRFSITILVLLAVIMMINPVMAHRPKKQKIPAQMWVKGFSTAEGEGYCLWETRNGIIIEKNLIVTYDPILLIVDGNLPGIAVSNTFRIANTNKGKSIIFYDTVWSFPVTGREFKGKMFAKLSDLDTASPMLDVTCVLRGSGAFEGQTLKLSLEGPLYAPLPWTGNLFK